MTTTAGWTGRRAVALAGSVLALAVGLGLVSESASADWMAVVEHGTAGHLSLRGNPYPAQFLGMSPGSVRHWQVAVGLVDASAPLSLQIRRDGKLVARPDGLQVQVRSCEHEWADFPSDPRCAAPATVIGPVPAGDLRLGSLGLAETVPVPVFDLGTITSRRDTYLLITLSIPDTPDARSDTSLMGLQADLAIGLTASGDDVPPLAPSATPSTSALLSPGLAGTGVDITATLLLAGGAIGAGVVLRGAHRRRQRPGGGGRA